MTGRDGFSYIGRKPCGCIVCCIVDEPDMKRDVATEVAKWIKWGLTVEHVTHQYVRENFTENCPHVERQAVLL